MSSVQPSEGLPKPVPCKFQEVQQARVSTTGFVGNMLAFVKWRLGVLGTVSSGVSQSKPSDLVCGKPSTW